MRFLFLTLASFLLYNSLYSQNQIKERDSFLDEIIKFFPQTGNEFVLDSTYDFDGSDLPENEWSTFTKEVVSERTANGLPKQVLSISKWNEADFYDTIYKQQIDFSDLNDVDHFIITNSHKDIFTHEWEQANKTILTTENDFEATIEQTFQNGNWLNYSKQLRKETSLSYQTISLYWKIEESIWEYKYRYSINIDTSNNTEITLNEAYENQMWDTTYIQTNYSNNYGSDTLVLSKRNKSGILTNDKKISCDFDDTNRMLNNTEYDWNESLNKWSGIKKYKYSYDSNFISKTLLWGEDSVWVPHYKEISEFNNDNYEISLTRLFYNTESDEWENSAFYESEYNGDLILFRRMFGWVDTSWIATDYIGYEYDEQDRLVYRYCNNPNYPKDRTIFEYINEEQHQSYSWHRQTYNRIDEIWINSEKNVEFENRHLNNIENESYVIAEVKPNPASDFLYIDLPNLISNQYSFSIFDINGKITKEGKITPNKMIDIRDLKIGPYILEIRLNYEKSYSSMFIKI